MIDEKDIEAQIEYLLFVDHEVDMKQYLPLVDSSVISDLTKLVVHNVNKYVKDNNHDLMIKLSSGIKENINDIIGDTFKNINKPEPITAEDLFK